MMEMAEATPKKKKGLFEQMKDFASETVRKMPLIGDPSPEAVERARKKTAETTSTPTPKPTPPPLKGRPRQIQPEEGATPPSESAWNEAEREKSKREVMNKFSNATRTAIGMEPVAASGMEDDPKYRQYLEEEKKITPTDLEGAAARARKRYGR